MIRKIFTLSILMLIFTSTAFTQQLKVTTNLQEVKQFYQNTPIISDVMGKINYIRPSGVTSPAEVDSFALFNGFPVSVSGQSMEGGIFCNLDDDPDLEFVYCITYSVVALNSDCSAVTGWPKTLSQPTQSAPAFGDIDGNGEGEIVVTTWYGTTAGSIYAWHKDGTPVTGFPVNSGYTTRSPVLADLNNDGALEIITNKRMYPVGEEWVYNGDGTPLWSAPINHVPASSGAAGDITGDGVPEVICESYVSVYAFDNAGNTLPGWPFNLPAGVTLSYSSPVLVDVNGDGIREVIFATHSDGGPGYVYILKNDGTVFPGWPKVTSYWIYTPPAVGYIDGDNILDVCVGDQVLSGTPVDHVYAWNVNGTALSGFPIGPVNAINSQIILADLDNNGTMDLITDDNGAPVYHGYNSNGTLLSGWPLNVTGESTFYEMPALADVNNDGVLDMLGAGTQGITNPIVFIHLWDTGYPFIPENNILPVFQYNERHTGVYGDLSLTVPVDLVSFTVNVSGNNVILNWATAAETNNKGFEVQRSEVRSQRSEVRGQIWETVGFVEGHGTTTEAKIYSYTDGNLDPGTYSYRLKQVDFDGTYKYSNVVEVNLQAPGTSSLKQNYPNPFNPSTKIEYTIPKDGFVSLKVYNELGEEVARLVNGMIIAGNHEAEFNAKGMASGIYYYRLEYNDRVLVNKMMVLK